MDQERKKRKQSVKILATEGAMVISVIVIVALLMFMVMGYSLKTGGDEWGVEQSGLVQLVSTPSGASIEIDGDGIFQRTETSRMLSEGTHSVKLYREGYDDWTKTISVRPGVFLRLKYPRLFKNEREAEEAKRLTDVSWMSFADNRSSILYTKNENTQVWHWLSLKNDRLTETEIDTNALFSGTVEYRKWVGQGEKMLTKVNENGAIKWLIVDLKTPARTVNLTETFGMNFSKIEAENDAADKLWALENGNLRLLSVGNKESSGVLASGTEEFASNREEVIYVTKKAGSDERTIGVYKEGYSEGVQVATVEDAKLRVKVAMEEYLNDTYISYMAGQKFYSLKTDEFPIEGRKFEADEKFEKELGFLPDGFRASNNGQFVIMNSGVNVAVMDAETEQVYETTLENDQYFWVDDYLIGVVSEGDLIVRDFDGTNRRVLTKASGAYPAVITADGRWLYYIGASNSADDGSDEKSADEKSAGQKPIVLMREEL